MLSSEVVLVLLLWIIAYKNIVISGLFVRRHTTNSSQLSHVMMLINHEELRCRMSLCPGFFSALSTDYMSAGSESTLRSSLKRNYMTPLSDVLRQFLDSVRDRTAVFAQVHTHLPPGSSLTPYICSRCWHMS